MQDDGWCILDNNMISSCLISILACPSRTRGQQDQGSARPLCLHCWGTSNPGGSSGPLTPSRTAAPPFPLQDLLLQPIFFRPASNNSESCRFPAPLPTADSPLQCISPRPRWIKCQGHRATDFQGKVQCAASSSSLQPGQLTLQP